MTRPWKGSSASLFSSLYPLSPVRWDILHTAKHCRSSDFEFGWIRIPQSWCIGVGYRSHCSAYWKLPSGGRSGNFGSANVNLGHLSATPPGWSSSLTGDMETGGEQFQLEATMSSGRWVKIQVAGWVRAYGGHNGFYLFGGRDMVSLWILDRAGHLLIGTMSRFFAGLGWSLVCSRDAGCQNPNCQRQLPLGRFVPAVLLPLGMPLEKDFFC